ncbi:MAG: hypothetical protein AAGH40_11560 [Verrucomicrobiota bacterium]
MIKDINIAFDRDLYPRLVWVRKISFDLFSNLVLKLAKENSSVNLEKLIFILTDKKEYLGKYEPYSSLKGYYEEYMVYFEFDQETLNEEIIGNIFQRLKIYIGNLVFKSDGMIEFCHAYEKLKENNYIINHIIDSKSNKLKEINWLSEEDVFGGDFHFDILNKKSGERQNIHLFYVPADRLYNFNIARLGCRGIDVSKLILKNAHTKSFYFHTCEIDTVKKEIKFILNEYSEVNKNSPMYCLNILHEFVTDWKIEVEQFIQ